MKRLLQLVVLAAIAKVAFELVQRQRSPEPLPAGAPYEPAPVPRPTDPGPVAQPPPATADDLTEINGIGPVYAERLRKAGVTDFGALAAAASENLANDLDVSAATIADWQSQARELRS